MLKEMFVGSVFVVAALTQTPIDKPYVPTPVDPPKVSESGSEKGEGQDYARPTDCQLLRDLPSYEYTYQGATIFVPDGETLLKEINEDGLKGKEREFACKMNVDAYDDHMNNEE